MRIKITQFLNEIGSAAVAADVATLLQERRMLKDIQKYTETWDSHPDLLVLLVDAILCVLEDVKSYTYENEYKDGTREKVTVTTEDHFSSAVDIINSSLLYEREKIKEDYRIRKRMEFDVAVTLGDVINFTAAKSVTELGGLETSLKNVRARTAGDMNEHPNPFIELVQAIQSMLLSAQNRSESVFKAF